MQTRGKILDPGDRVWLPAQKVEGKVEDRADPSRSYMVETPTRLLWRNRRHLNGLPESPKAENTSSTPLKSQEPLNLRSVRQLNPREQSPEVAVR